MLTRKGSVRVKLALTALLLLGYGNTFSQLGTINDKNTAKTFMPASPEVAQMQRYGDIPVNYASGLPSISVPIWTLTLKDFAWPISLSYHSAGTQVSELASNVGLGWTLNASAVVSAKVISGNDLISPNYGDSIRRTLVTGGGNNTSCVYYNDVDQYMAGLLSEENTNTLPDIFYFNSPVNNNKFLLKGSAGYCMPRSNLRITYNKGAYPWSSNFTIIDENGNKYLCDVVGLNIRTSVCSTSPPVIQAGSYSFYVSKITTYSGEEINFSYTPETFVYPVQGSETSYEHLSALTCTECYNYSIASNVCTSKEIPLEQRLDYIYTSRGETINFYYSSRDDVSNKSKLDSVRISSYTDVGGTKGLFTKVLGTSYFGTGPDTTALRLRLDSIKTIDGTALENERYAFNYDTTSLPDRMSYAVDYFGYYNGQNGNTSLLLGNAYRAPDSAYARAGLISKIEYPTGGHTKFTYQYDYALGRNAIRLMEDVDSVGNNKVRFFSYPDLGTFVPTFQEPFTRHNFVAGLENGDPPAIPCNLGIMGSCWGTIVCNYYRHGTNPVVNTYNKYVEYIFYATVDEYFGSASQNGLIEYTYDYPKTSGNYYKVTDIGNFEGQLVRKEVYEKTGSGYRILSKEEYNYEVLEDQFDYFGEAVSSTEANSWGIEAIQQTQEISGHCGLLQVYCYAATYLQGNFKLVSSPLYLRSQILTDYSYTPGGVQQFIVTGMGYEYGDSANCGATKMATTTSDGKSLLKSAQYPTTFSEYPSLTSDEEDALDSLYRANKIGSPFYTFSKTDGNFTNKAFLSYKVNGTKAFLRQVRSYPSGTSAFRQIDYEFPDTKYNIRQVTDPSGITTALIYDTMTHQVVADVTGAPVANVAATSFEISSKGGWAYSGSANTNYSITGSKSYLISGGDITKSGLTSGTYIVAYWAKGGSVNVNSSGPTKTGKTIGDWTYYEHEVSGTSVTVSSGSTRYLDELRLFPQGSMLNSYTFRHMIGMTSRTDPNGHIQYYEYDNFGRLKLVKDEDGNILKRAEYKYKTTYQN